MPREDEIALAPAYLEHYTAQLGTADRTRMLDFGHFDVDERAHLGYFLKRQDGRWTYRKRRWSSSNGFHPDVSPLDRVLRSLVR